MKKSILSAFLFAFFLSLNAFAQTTLVERGAAWKYLDNGSNQGFGWTAPAFDDSAWAAGNAQLGYGDGDEVTTVGYGVDANNKYITTYFRKSFNFDGQVNFNNLTLDILRDDGAVVYLNGAEIYRNNLPTGAIGYRTLASTAVSGAEETTTFLQTTISPNLLVAGNNILAVEIHQVNATSSDISFDFGLIGQTIAPTASVTRGAYLQMGTANAMTIRWRTNIATNSRVQFGTIQGSLSQTTDDAVLTTEHEIRLTGLVANTKYFYSIGSTTQTLAGSDANHFFLTSPGAGQAVPYRIWVLGDSGTADANAQAVRNAYLNYNGSTYTNLLLMLGDNAYENGTDAEYQAAVFNMYPTILRQTPLWSTIGNHDTAQSTDPPSSLPYFQMFTLPTAAQAGGVASGTEKYYSFNYGNIHFICLDSMTSSRATNGAMLTWLNNDLTQNIQPWVIAFWHHPPYTKGSHNSDTETQLVEMRANVLPLLESWGVDLVLAGHSHSYERSFLIDGHYGTSGTFTNAMKKNAGGGRENIDGAYTKTILANVPNEGAVYAVAGSSGKISGGLLNHPAMFVSLNNLGSMILDFDGNRLDAKFLRENGTIADYFTIIKGAIVAYEADVSPRPSGDRLVQSDDVVQMRRFLNRTDTPDSSTDEFQRADCSPMNTRGDGFIRSDDIVQVRRYLNGSDALQPADGPKVPNGGSSSGQPKSVHDGKASVIDLKTKSATAAAAAVAKASAPGNHRRRLRVENVSVGASESAAVNILVDSVGDEVEYGFTINYQTSTLSNPVVTNGAAGAGAVSCNTTKPGQIFCSVGTFPTNRTGDPNIGEIEPGDGRALIKVRFTVNAGARMKTVSAITLSEVNVSDDTPPLALAITKQDGAVTITDRQLLRRRITFKR